MNRFKEVIDQLLSLSFQFGDFTDYLKWFGAEETDLSLHKLEEMRRQLAIKDELDGGEEKSLMLLVHF